TGQGTGYRATWNWVFVFINDIGDPAQVISGDAFVTGGQIRGLTCNGPTIGFVTGVGDSYRWHFTGHAETVTGVALVTQRGGTVRDGKHQRAWVRVFATGIVTESTNICFYGDVAFGWFIGTAVFHPEFVFEQVGNGGVIDVATANIVITNGGIQDRIRPGSLEEVWDQVVGVVTGGPTDGWQLTGFTSHFGEVWIIFGTAEVPGFVVGSNHKQCLIPG